MITVIYGAPGAGKGALMTKFIYDLYYSKGDEILAQSKERIEYYNRLFEGKRKKTLSLPSKVPFYSDFPVEFSIGYERTYSTYLLNGYYFGLENSSVPVQYVAPYSKLFLTEVQRYYDSRQSSTLQDFVSRAYEMHRHYHLDIYLDLQRLGLLDLNIRELAGRFILIEELEHEYNDLGFIIRSTWYCKEFTTYADVDLYVKSKTGDYLDVKFIHEGCIFDCFDSFSNELKFLPSDDSDFSYLEHNTVYPKGHRNSVYYDFSMPDYYRSKRK